MSVADDKRTMRRAMLERRKGLSGMFRSKADADINAALASLPELDGSLRLAAYVSDGTEPDLTMFIARSLRNGKRVFLPRSSRINGELVYGLAELRDPDRELRRGAYGIMEPDSALREADAEERREMVWLVPGVAFDARGGRLGRGKGFYDRLLECGDGIRIGIFYECQKVEAVPEEEHDRRLDVIVTESGVIRLKP